MDDRARRRRRVLRAGVLAALIPAAIAACARPNPPAKERASMAHVINRKCDFSKIGPLLESNECTPRIDGFDFEGLLINLPEEVVYDGNGSLSRAGGKLILAGACRFKQNFLNLHGSFVDHILFVAVNARTHQTYASKLETVPNAIPGPDPDDGLEPAMLVGEVFNPDLGDLLRLPAEEAEYIVYATIGPHRSNALTTRVRPRRSP